jgi:hypothetical protein
MINLPCRATQVLSLCGLPLLTTPPTSPEQLQEGTGTFKAAVLGRISAPFILRNKEGVNEPYSYLRRAHSLSPASPQNKEPPNKVPSWVAGPQGRVGRILASHLNRFGYTRLLTGDKT